MFPPINRLSGIPYYLQVRDSLREHLRLGTWAPGQQLPGEPELCRIFGVSRPVIRQALDELARQGLVVREKGRGTFVAQPKIRESLMQKLTGFYQDMLEQGLTPVTRVLRHEIVPASREVAQRLALEPDAPVIAIERLRFVEDVPIQLVTTYLPQQLCPALTAEALGASSLYAFLEQRCGLLIVRGDRSIEAVPANEVEAHWLQVKKGSPLLLLDSVSFLADGTPVEYYHALHRGDRARFEVQLRRVRAADDADPFGDQLESLPASSAIVRRCDAPKPE